MSEQDSSWKKRAFGVIQACETELRRTTAIGMKMVQASKASGELHETYEELGKALVRAIKNRELEWRDPHIRVLMTRAEDLELLLNEMEGVVQDLKTTRRD